MNSDAQLLGGLAAGALGGLVPWWIARRKGRRTAASVSFWMCLATGVVGGLLLALPAAIVASIVVLAGGGRKPVVSVPGGNLGHPEPSAAIAPMAAPEAGAAAAGGPPAAASTAAGGGALANWIIPIGAVLMVSALGYGDAIAGSRFVTGAVVGVAASVVASMVLGSGRAHGAAANAPVQSASAAPPASDNHIDV